MNILFLGHFFPQNLLKDVIENSRGLIGFSNHNFELSIINGLANQKGVHLRVISIPNVYSYPYHNKSLFTPKESYEYDGVPVNSIGFCNLPVIKELGSTLACARRIIKVIHSFPAGDVHVIINTASKRLIDALRLARHFITHRELTQTVIIPDLPAMLLSMGKCNPIKQWLLEKRNRSVMQQTAKSNGLVLLTNHMIDLFNPKPEYIVMEGIINTHTANKYQSDFQSNNNEIILYTGTLRRIFGVMSLVEAFKQIADSNVELWICGSGEASDDIKKEAELDPRIKFFGLVSSSEALDKQSKATVLVNPRTSNGEYTKYSFPSKTMEYLLAGKSVVINKLPGMPEEYFKYVFIPEDESINALAKCLSMVIHLDKSTRLRLSKSGRDFVIRNKNADKQASRIVQLINGYNG